MPADTFSSVLGWLQMGTGNDNNTWGVNHNSQVSQIFENAIAGQLSQVVTGGTLDLSGSPPPAGPSQVAYAILNFSGTLTSNQTVVVPNLTNRWIVFNGTSGAFQLLMKTPSGAAANMPQGMTSEVWCDGANNIRRIGQRTGMIEAYGGSSAPAGTLACDGGVYTRTDFPELFTSIGTTWNTGGESVLQFRVPQLQDTGRFLRSKSASLLVGSSQANAFASHSHGVNISDPGHGHGVSDPGHNHSGNTGGADHDLTHTHSVPSGGGSQLVQSGSTQGNIAKNDSQTTGNNSADMHHTHSIPSGGTGIGIVAGGTGISATANAAGGSETRPEAAVVLYCIRI